MSLEEVLRAFLHYLTWGGSAPDMFLMEVTSLNAISRDIYCHIAGVPFSATV